MTLAIVCPCASPPTRVRRIIMSRVPLNISLLDWFFLGISLSTRSSMQRDNIPHGLLWEETCESSLAAIGQLATTDQCAYRQDCGRMVGHSEVIPKHPLVEVGPPLSRS